MKKVVEWQLIIDGRDMHAKSQRHMKTFLKAVLVFRFNWLTVTTNEMHFWKVTVLMLMLKMYICQNVTAETTKKAARQKLNIFRWLNCDFIF